MIAINIGTYEIPEWVDLAFGGGGGGLPTIASGDAGKVVSVKADLSGYELVATGSSISAYVKSTDLSTTNSIKFTDQAGTETTFTVDFSSYQPKIDSSNKLDFSLISNTPTTLTGYGITDTYNKTEVDAQIKIAKDIAEGKTKTVVIKIADNAAFNSQEADITALKVKDINTVEYDKSTLKVGDFIAVKDTAVPDRWVSDIDTTTGTITFSASEISKTILTGYVTETDLTTTLANYQSKITSSNKLSFTLLSDVPTTISGYGITDAYTKTDADSTFLKVANIVSAFQATPDNDHIASEKLVYDQLLLKQVKLTNDDGYLTIDHNNGTLNLTTIPTKKGEVVICEYDTNEKMKTNYGGTYWRVIDYDPITGVRKWKRTDDSPILECFEGFIIKNTGTLDTVAKVKAAYGGVDWTLLGVHDTTYEWECSDNSGYTTTKKPCNIGDIISGYNLATEADVIAQYNAEGFTLIGSYTDNGVTRYEWECTTCASPATFKPSVVGMHYETTALTTVADVKALFDSAEVTTTWELLGNYGTKFEYRRIS